MALELLSTLTSSDGCVGFTFTDSTGVYNASTNTGGYGAPNMDSTDVNTASISIYAPKSTVPYVFNFVIDIANILSCIITNPDGTTNDITADITALGLVFPFDTTIGAGTLPILGTYLGFEEGDMVTDGVWTSVYEISDGLTEYNTTTYLLSQCATCCCVNKMFVNLSKCGCTDSKISTAQKADAFLKSATFAANLGMMTQAQEDLDKASEICDGNCDNC